MYKVVLRVDDRNKVLSFSETLTTGSYYDVSVEGGVKVIGTKATLVIFEDEDKAMSFAGISDGSGLFTLNTVEVKNAFDNMAIGEIAEFVAILHSVDVETSVQNVAIGKCRIKNAGGSWTEHAATPVYYAKGDTGMSAYELAVKYGYEGTEEEWVGEFAKAEEERNRQFVANEAARAQTFTTAEADREATYTQKKNEIDAAVKNIADPAAWATVNETAAIVAEKADELATAISAVGMDVVVSDLPTVSFGMGGASFTKGYPSAYLQVRKGDKVTIVGNSSLAGKACFIKAKPTEIAYNYNPTTKGTWMSGETAFRDIGINAEIKVEVTENCYLYVNKDVDGGQLPSKIIVMADSILSREIEENQEANNARLKALEEGQGAIESEIVDIKGKMPDVTTIASQAKTMGQGVQGYDAEKGYASISVAEDYYTEQRIYVDNGVGQNQTFSIPSGNKKVFVKAEVVTEEEGITFSMRFNRVAHGGIDFKAGFEANKIHSILLGEYTDDGSRVQAYLGISSFRRNGGVIGAHEKVDVEIRVYGVYIVDASTVGEDAAELAEFLNFSKDVSYIIEKARSSATSIEARHSLTSDKAIESETSERSAVYETALKGKVIGLYGDSLVTFIGWDRFGAYLGADAVRVGQGGGKVGNNSAGVKQGFCTMERLALLPKDMRFLVIYAGANDTVTRMIDGVDQVDPELLGTIDDEPLKIADMMNYRVTAQNMETTGTLGRAKTFYQAYKTMLRNVMLLFPSCEILCVAQHPSYYYVKPEGGFSEDLIRKRGTKQKIKAILDCCEEFGVPVCNLWATSGVNDHNVRITLVDAAGVAVHPQATQSKREESLILNAVLNNADKFDIGLHNDNDRNTESKELHQWVIDLRDLGVLTLGEAIAAFVSRTTEKEIELKNNMYMVFSYDVGANKSKGYFLTNAANPTATSSWEEWVIQDIVDPNGTEGLPE